MDMTRAKIPAENIRDDLWPEILLAMAHIGNLRPMY